MPQHAINREKTMTITLEEIIAVQHQALNTLPRKIIYLMIRNGEDATGWATISRGSFSSATALQRRSVDYVIKHLMSVGLIERRKSAEHINATYQYRVIEA
jgi:predicted transcriptional regulator